MLYLLATLALILRVNAIPGFTEHCLVDVGMVKGGVQNDLNWPQVLIGTNLQQNHTKPELLEDYEKKTIEAFQHEGVTFRVIFPDGSTSDGPQPMPNPVGAKWVIGSWPLIEDEEGEDIASEDEPEPTWGNVYAECIEKDGEYVWSTTLGDLYVAMFERDNADCVYVKGEDVNGCDTPVEPPIVEPATTTDEIEIDTPETQDPEPVDPQPLAPVDDTTNKSDLENEDKAADKSGDDLEKVEEIAQQQENTASGEKVAKQSFPVWAIPTAVGGTFVIILSYLMYQWKRKVISTASPDIEAPQDVQIVPQQA